MLTLSGDFHQAEAPQLRAGSGKNGSLVGAHKEACLLQLGNALDQSVLAHETAHLDGIVDTTHGIGIIPDCN